MRYDKLLKKEHRTIEFKLTEHSKQTKHNELTEHSKRIEHSVEDIPIPWRLWLYHHLIRPPVQYSEHLNYSPPDIAPDYDPNDPKAREMCEEYIRKLLANPKK